MKAKQRDRNMCQHLLARVMVSLLLRKQRNIKANQNEINANEKEIKPKLFLAREKDVRYSIDSWKDGYFYLHTNKNAEDYKILRCKNDNLNELEEYIPAKKGTIVGGFEFLDNYMIRAESSDAIPKLYIKNLKTNKEEEIKISKEQVGSPGVSLMQRDIIDLKLEMGSVF